MHMHLYREDAMDQDRATRRRNNATLYLDTEIVAQAKAAFEARGSSLSQEVEQFLVEMLGGARTPVVVAAEDDPIISFANAIAVGGGVPDLPAPFAGKGVFLDTRVLLIAHEALPLLMSPGARRSLVEAMPAAVDRIALVPQRLIDFKRAPNGRLLTARGALFEQDFAVQSILAVYEDGHTLVSVEHRNDPQVRVAIARIDAWMLENGKTLGAKVGVDLETIRRAYVRDSSLAAEQQKPSDMAAALLR